MASPSRRPDLRKHVGMPSPAPRLEPGAPPPPPPPRCWPAVPAAPQRRPALFADVLPARPLAPPPRRLTPAQAEFLKDVGRFACLLVVIGCFCTALWLAG